MLVSENLMKRIEIRMSKEARIITSELSHKKIAIYCRVSTVEQAEEGYSIDEQERLLI